MKKKKVFGKKVSNRKKKRKKKSLQLFGKKKSIMEKKIWRKNLTKNLDLFFLPKFKKICQQSNLPKQHQKSKPTGFRKLDSKNKKERIFLKLLSFDKRNSLSPPPSLYHQIFHFVSHLPFSATFFLFSFLENKEKDRKFLTSNWFNNERISANRDSKSKARRILNHVMEHMNLLFFCERAKEGHEKIKWKIFTMSIQPWNTFINTDVILRSK